MTPANLIQHEIAANNIFIGPSTFLSLALPQTWNITLGAGRPEVTGSREHSGRRWVATGDAWYVLHDQSRRWAMEVRLTAKLLPNSPPKNFPPDMTIAGHPACVVWTQRKRGFIKRWLVTYVTVEFCCPHTDRLLRLEFSGSAPEEAFREIVEAVRYTRCH
jgi:hypothetical protein